MKKLVTISLATALFALMASGPTFMSGAYAQNEEQSSQQGSSAPSAGQEPASGTKPEDMGSSGWTGGSTGAGTGSETGTTGSNINNDSEYATGSDLNGPAVNFPPSRTPE